MDEKLAPKAQSKLRPSSGRSHIEHVLLKDHFLRVQQPGKFYSVPMDSGMVATKLRDFLDVVPSKEGEAEEPMGEADEKLSSGLLPYVCPSAGHDVVFQVGMINLGSKRTVKVARAWPIVWV